MDPARETMPPGRRALTPARLDLAFRAAVMLAVLASYSHYYSPRTGFTALIQFSQSWHAREIPAVQQAPHFDHPPAAAYDGQFYAQMAVDPLLSDPAIDRAMDNPPYRARRILASWTAYVIGGGVPERVIRVFAAQNLAVFAGIGGLLLWVLPPGDGRSAAAWTACMLSPGLATAVRFSLPDALGAALTLAAVIAAERRRLWVAAGLIGLAGLARETFLLALPVLWIAADRGVLRSMAAAVVAAAPFLLWQDYVYSIYRSGALTTGRHVGHSGMVYVNGVLHALEDLSHGPWGATDRSAAFTGISLLTQGVFVLTRLDWRSSWWWVGCATGGLMLLVPPKVTLGSPRVFLPLTFAFGALLPSNRRWFWPLLFAGNLFVLVTIELLVKPWWHSWP